MARNEEAPRAFVKRVRTLMEGAYATSTINGYEAAFLRLVNWCEREGLPALSLADEDLARYITEYGEAVAPKTVKLALTGIGAVLRLGGAEDFTDGPEVKLAWRRLARAKGLAAQQAVPLTRVVLRALLATCGNDVRGQRDRALLLLGYYSLCRGTELCRFTFADLEPLPGGRYAIHLAFSKTDQEGHGRRVPLPESVYRALCRWQETVGDERWILRPVRNGRIGNAPMTAQAVGRVLQHLQARAGIQLPRLLTSHSFRIGAAIDLLNDGVPLEQIMLRGGWRSSSSAMLYLKQWQLAQDFETHTVEVATEEELTAPKARRFRRAPDW
ncbi:tyrosine-type recombinase/integrase [Pseudohaliea rubra]|uniref:Integrase-like protein n=1 Tax=Pseudohaliea rubra DSM 19751 TaxID=1265313 RepID=A0A095WYW5_9GAMM|nr:tyrosine-type recombinase/integrase [Pseudohaliea rubra]KGE03829.1 Integrase-like protein [Pseudohaliea rubra DSM 19751]